MKHVLLLLPFLASCTPEPSLVPHAQQLIRSQISTHYDSLHLKGYYPLSISEIDTIATTHNQHGDVTAIIGEVTHHYRAIKGGVLAERTEVFDVQVYKDGVVTMPAKPQLRKRDPQLIQL